MHAHPVRVPQSLEDAGPVAEALPVAAARHQAGEIAGVMEHLGVQLDALRTVSDPGAARAAASKRARVTDEHVDAEVDRATHAEADTTAVREQVEAVHAEAEQIRARASELRGTIASLTAVKRPGFRSESPEGESVYAQEVHP